MIIEPKIEWKWGVFAALALTIIALYPQINLWLARGSEWQGSYVLTQGDEVAYSAYINALIDGRPRRNDPFTGHDDFPNKPTHESLFSIQFVPAYAIALPARALGISTSTVFIWLIVIGAFTSSLAIFWLLATLSGDSKLAAAGALFTLCFGALAAAQGFARFQFAGQRVHDMFSFLRRYQPSLVFPLFFVFCLLIWRALTRENAKARLLYSLAAGGLFSILVFSYFFIWTAALAWFAGLSLLWVLFKRDDFRRIAVTGPIVGAFAIAAVIPFFVMLSHRNKSMDQTQLLVLTRAPDLLYSPEIIGFIVLGVIGYACWRKLVEFRTPLVLFAASFAVMPFVLFNQQVISGRSLQPIHYKVFIANYVALISVTLVFFILWRALSASPAIPSRVLIFAALATLGWGVVEVSDITQRDSLKARLRDEVLPVAYRLTAMAREDGSLAAALAGSGPFPVVYASTLDVSGSIPSDSPLAVLWALHTPASGVSLAESKERFYLYMYYSGLSQKELATAMAQGQFIVLAPLFGVERVIEGLAPDQKPIAVHEMREELRRYTDFSANFTREQASHPTLSLVVVPSGDARPNFGNLDKWYERDAGEEVGIFTIYRVKLRPQN
ncbi:MAG: hypothetical protein ND895_08720 [Pyrinomonadaceae bacterium]|nr:hypothetical protein [Pyrinomonadaceae bacterium]